MIEYEFEARVVGNGQSVPVQVYLGFNPDDPLAATMLFEVGDESTKMWEFGRDLLVTAANRTHPVGEGDVRFRCVEQTGLMYMYLFSDTGRATIALPLEQIRGFLTDTTEEAAIPTQTIESDLDRFLTEVLG